MLKARAFGISISARWISREDQYKKLADLGSRGPWFPAQEYSLDASTMRMVLAYYSFAIDSMASFKNIVVSRYISLAYEPEALAQNFFEFTFDEKEFIWFFPPMRIFWYGLLHLKNCRSRQQQPLTTLCEGFKAFSA